MAVKKFSLEAIIDLTDKMTKPLNAIEKNMTGFSKKMQKNFGGVGNNIKSIDKGINKAAIGIGVGALAIGAGAFAVGKSFIDSGAEVEKYKTTLTTMLGSVDLANQRFEEMSKFAASTPFELNEVVQLGNQLQALGKYSKENMTILGDLAAAAGKPIDQVTSAYAKLVSGQKGEGVNMFRDLLISTKDWTEATGKGIKKSGELMATTDEMIAALPKILAKKGFSGMMDNLSKSYEGMSSNFNDTITRFKQGIGTALLPAAKNLMGVLTKKIMEFTDVTNVKGKKAVAAFSKLIDDVAKAIENFDLAKAMDSAGKFAESVVNAGKIIKEILPIILVVVAEIKLVTLAMTVYSTVAAIAGVASLPFTAIILGIMVAVALLTIGIYELVKHWPAVKKFLGEFGNGLILLLGPIGVVINNIMILVQSISGIAAAFKNGGFIEGIKAIGATMLQMLIKPISQLLTLLSKIPGVGGLLGPLAGALSGASGSLDKTINGYKSTGATSSVLTSGMPAQYQQYSNPDTRVAESRTSTSSTSRSEVFVRADNGATVSDQRGGAPKFNLAYGAAQ